MMFAVATPNVTHFISFADKSIPEKIAPIIVMAVKVFSQNLLLLKVFIIFTVYRFYANIKLK